MPHLIHWTETAREGLEKAYLFLVEKNEDAAIAAIKAIREKALLLKQFPNAGRPAEDLEPEHRELLIPFGSAGYVLLYYFAESGGPVTVLAIRHQKEVGY
jgi:toxin ParE1/3/4